MTRAVVDSLPRLPLSQLLADGPSWSLKERLVLARRLALALQVLHHQGQTHRAIDAATVTVDGKFRPELGPPAGPRRFGGDQSNPEFCPPELAQGSAVELPAEIEAAAAILRQRGTPLDPRRIDVYQLGVLLCQLLTGEAFLNYLYSPTCKAKVPAMARDVLERCLGENPAGAIVDCYGLVEALDGLIRQVQGKEATSNLETPPLGSAVVSPDETPPHGRAVAPPVKKSAREKVPFQQLGHFQIVDHIGSGGMGDVYKGYDASLERYVAIKVLAPTLARDEEFVRRFSAEATAAAKVSHPNVVPIYFIGHDADHHFFAMQFIEGQSLSQRLLSAKRLPVDKAVAIIEQCLAGLEAAHNQALIHRDVKPGNILLERGSDRAVLVDFGLARHLNAGSRMTATGVVMGTVDYVAPEQARGQAVNGRTDIYSLGVMFYELLAGRLPFISDSPTSMLFQHAYEKPFPLKQAVPDVPQPLVDIIAHMMAKEPADRYPLCAAALADLRAFREGRPVAAAPASSVEAVVQLPPQQSPPRQGATTSVPDDEPAADWGTEDDAPLPSEEPLQRAKDFAATMFRRYAPQQVQEMQGTTVQMDAAVAQYERRRNRLAGLLKEGRGIEADLSEQIKAQLAAAAEAAGEAAASAADHVKDAALAKKCECEENAASLRSQRDVQRQEVADLERQLSKADATLARLRNQQNMLKARLQAAEARRQMEGGLPKPKRHRRLVPLAIGTGLLALVSLLLILGRFREFPPPVELPTPTAHENMIVNGDFEEPVAPLSSWALIVGGQSFPGWTVGGHSVALLNTYHLAAHSGNQSLNLSGTAAGSIAQNVATTPGTTYLLSFWYCGHFFHPYSGDAYAEVFWNGDVVDTIHLPASKTPRDVNWTFVSYKLPATTTSSELKFKSTSPNGGIVLDQVSLVTASGVPADTMHAPVETPSIDKMVTEGVGWGGFRVGATRDELVKAFGPLEPSPGTHRTGWIRTHHIDYWFDPSGRAVEILFAKGFDLPLASGIRIGSAESDVLSAYGTASRTVQEPSAHMLEFGNRGVLMWIKDGRVSSFTVFKPSNPMIPPPTTDAGWPEFARDAKLNEAQRRFRDLSERAVRGDLYPISESRLQAMTPAERAAEEQLWLSQLPGMVGRAKVPAINALALLGSKTAVAELLKIATERRQGDNRPRWMAARALGWIGDPSVIPELVPLTYHYNQDARMWAQISLVRLTGENFADDVSAWSHWWQLQGGTPPISEDRIDWKTSASAAPSLRVDGLAGMDSIAPTEFPPQWRSNDAFANITSPGRIIFPTLPVSSYVLEAEVASRNPAGKLVFHLGDCDFSTELNLGHIWDKDKDVKRILCRLFSCQPFGVNWLGGRDYEAGSRLKLKIVVPDGQKKWLYVNGQPELEGWAVASDLTLEIRAEGDVDATIYSCALRKLDEDDIQGLGLEMPQRRISVDPDLPARLAKEAAGLGEVPEQGSSFRAPTTGTVMNWINPGEFVMGTSGAPYDQFGKGAQRVQLTKGYWIGRYQVTQGEWERLMGNNPSRVQGSPYLPVNWINLVDAAAFCRKLTDAEKRRGGVPEGYEYRLPTEAEWEYACAAGTDGQPAPGTDSPAATQPKDLKAPIWRHDFGHEPPNAWGLCDMRGIVPEWCADAWRPYPADGATKTVQDRFERGGLDLDRFVVRGGALSDRYTRSRATPSVADDYRSFRLVLGKELKR